MSWLKTIFDFGRGKVNETGEAIANDPRVAIAAMEQSIRDADSKQEQARSALTDVMAQEKLTAKSVADLEAKMAEYEGYALQADSQGDEALLSEVIEKIAGIETELVTQRAIQAGMVEQVNNLKRTVAETERNIKSMKTEIKTIKATEYAQQAAMEASAKYSGASSDTRRAAERMKRIKENQAHRKAKMEAAQELEKATNGEDLKVKLAAAGIGTATPQRDDILARIRAKQG